AFGGSNDKENASRPGWFICFTVGYLARIELSCRTCAGFDEHYWAFRKRSSSSRDRRSRLWQTSQELAGRRNNARARCTEALLCHSPKQITSNRGGIRAPMGVYESGRKTYSYRSVRRRDNATNGRTH